ncbi:MAG: T9SS type A sorting domain-containing protein [Bacteroidetes bacterium]|nr:T9SS type A sorting domain-containing protein [Bacteroidota bacterium]
MKYTLPLFFLLVMGLSMNSLIQAQTTILFDTTFTISTNDTVFDILLDESGDCILVGATDTVPDRSILWLRKMGGVHGDSLWEKTHEFDTTILGMEMIATADLHYIVAGSKADGAWLFKFDEDGELVNEFGFTDTVTYFSRVRELPNSDLIVLQTLQENKNRSRVMRLTSEGNIVWDMDYIGYEYNGLVQYTEDRFMVSGWNNDLQYPHPILTSYTLNGDSIFTNQINELYGPNLGLIQDGSTLLMMNRKKFLISNSYIGNVTRVDENGDYLWFEELKSPGSAHIRDILVYDDYVIAGSEHNSTSVLSVIISVITSDGSLINGYMIQKPGPVKPILTAMVNQQNMLFITGIQTADTNGNKGVFLTKIDLDSLLVTTVNRPEIVAADGFSVFPNPAGEELHIRLDEAPDQNEIEILIFNSNGILVKNDTFKGPVYKTTVEAYSEGLYFIKLIRPDGVMTTRKIVIMH